MANVVVAPKKGERWKVYVDFIDRNKVVMPFELKNIGATYQRLVNKKFIDLIKDTMEVYIDVMLVKNLNATDHIGQSKKKPSKFCDNTI